jgi:serine protease AprX
MCGRRVAWLVICLLAAMLPAGAADAAPNARPTAPAAPAKADLDGDGVFDDLESRVATLADSDETSVIVVLRERALPDRVARLRQEAALDVFKRYELIDAVAGRVTKGRLRALARHPLVDHVEANSAVHALNDTAQQSFGVTPARVNAPAIEGNADGNVATYSAGDLVAAVLDSGIDAGHRDLDEGKVIAFRDFVNGLTTPYDDDGHGTHVAATLAGEGDARADLLYRGVAPGAALVGVKVLDSNGNGATDDVISGIQWAVANKTLYGIEAINLSIGAPGCNNGTDSISQAVNAAHDAGLVVAVAAGNSGPGTCTIETPGAAAKALTVGSMADLGVSGFFQSFTSSRGRTLDGRVKPDVSAPGVDVTSAAAGSVTGYVLSSGTSMATPFVAGVALLMREANPALTSQAVKDKVMQTAIDWGRGATNGAGTTGPDPEYGAGRLDAYAALASSGAPIGPAPTGRPTHLLREGTMSGTGAQFDYPIEVRDTRFPIAATMIVPSISGATSNNPDFDLYLLSPGGAEVASSEFTTRQEEFGYQPTTTGTYTVRVRSFRGNGGFFVDISAGLEDPGYARPKGASPVRASLVPAYQACGGGTANRTHGPPLAHPSCNPPSRTSGFLTVGSPDANGQSANFVGHVRLVANVGDPSTPADEADVAFSVDAEDVRRSAGLAAYTGELETRLGMRLTDKQNGTSLSDSATTQDFSFDFTVPCSAGSCAVTTSADAVTPGSVVEGKRAMWQLGQVRVFDGGPDGDVDTPAGDTLFAVQGVFVP